MPKFQEYNGMIVTRKRELKNIGFKVKKDQIENLALEMSRHEMLNNSQLNLCTIMNELLHYSLSNTCVQLSSNIAEKFAKSEIRLNLDELQIPIRIFELLFEENFEINGIKMLPTIVLFCPDKSIIDSFKVIYDKTQRHIFEQTRLLLEDFDKSFIRNKIVLHSSDVKNDRLYGSFIEVDRLIKDGIEKTITNVKTLETTTKLDEEDEKRLAMLYRVIFSLICYLNTKEKDLKYSKDNSKLTTNKSATIMKIGFSESKTNLKWHIRSGCFHVLKHERFKRREDGTYNVIWVKPSIINKEKAPSFPKEKLTVITNQGEKTC